MKRSPTAIMPHKDCRRRAKIKLHCATVSKQAMDEMGLSARAFDKVRRVARTIPDLAAMDTINEACIAEAVQYRLLDRKF